MTDLDALEIPEADVARMHDCHVTTLRSIIRDEDEAMKPDAIRFIPGGRYARGKYRIDRETYWKGRRGELPQVFHAQVEQAPEPQAIEIRLVPEIVVAQPPKSRKATKPRLVALEDRRDNNESIPS